MISRCKVAPPGMSINASTGLVTWSPTAFQTGTSAVTVLATDQFGNVAQQAFGISVSRSFAIYAPSCPRKDRALVGTGEPSYTLGFNIRNNHP